MSGDSTQTYLAGTLSFSNRLNADTEHDEYPQGWRETVMRLYPNGRTPLTGLTSLMKTEKVSSGPEYNWWEQELIPQRANILDASIHERIPTDVNDQTVLPRGSVMVYRINEEAINQFRPGMIGIAGREDNALRIRARVTAVSNAGTYGWMHTILLDPWPENSYSAINGGYFSGIGNAAPDMGVRPEGTIVKPIRRENKMQIFRDSCSIPRTVMQTRNWRTGDQYMKLKKDALEMHSIGMEKAFFWGMMDEWMDNNGHPNRTTEGILTSILNEEKTGDFHDAAATAIWKTHGQDWLNNELEEMFRLGTTERLAFAGTKAVLGLQQIAEEKGTINVSPGQMDWGLRISRWITYFGEIDIITHPLFSQDPLNWHTIAMVEPQNITYKYMQDTMFKEDRHFGKGGGTGVDGKEEEWLTHCGLMLEFPQTGRILYNVGKDE